MKVIDTNTLVIILVGLIDPKLITKHKRTSFYEETDFYDLIQVIEKFEYLVVLPNVWTEVDNLLNDFRGGHKDMYIQQISNTIKMTSEKYLESFKASTSVGFYDLGLTDSLLLEYSRECEMLITTDSTLSDYAIASGIKVYDVVKNRNVRISNSR